MDEFSVSDLRQIQRLPFKLEPPFINRIRRYWCPYAQSKGFCDHACSANPFCAENIYQAINEIKDADDPVAILVYRLRRQKARMSEELAAAEHSPIGRNPLGEAVSGDAFSRIKVMIGD